MYSWIFAHVHASVFAYECLWVWRPEVNSVFAQLVSTYFFSYLTFIKAVFSFLIFSFLLVLWEHHTEKIDSQSPRSCELEPVVGCGSSPLSMLVFYGSSGSWSCYHKCSAFHLFFYAGSLTEPGAHSLALLVDQRARICQSLPQGHNILFFTQGLGIQTKTYWLGTSLALWNSL